MTKKYDVIVVGAGNGGLTAATKLALEGKKVLLFERHNLPGGFGTSFVRGRFEFEASLHALCDVGRPGDFGEVGTLFHELGVFDRIEWEDIHEGFCLWTLDGQMNGVSIPFALEGFIDAIEAEVPGSRESVTEFMDIGREVTECLYYFTSVNGKTDNLKMLKEHPRFINLASYTADEVFEKLNMPKRAREIIGSYWCYIGKPTDELSFVFFAGMIYMYAVHGGRNPKLTSHEISVVLLERFYELGGEARFTDEVKKLIVNDRRVGGVVDEHGEIYKADHVICNCSPHAVYGHMVDNPPRSAVKAANARELGCRGFSVFLGLNKSPEELGIKHHNVFVYGTPDSKTEYEAIARWDGHAQATCCLNLVNPQASPPGTSIVYMTRLFGSDLWSEANETNYLELKRETAQRMIEDYEHCTGVSLTPYIEEIEIASPVTYAHYTGTPQGIIYGYLPVEWDSLMPRLLTMDDEEPIKGLRFSGGYAIRQIGFSSSYVCGGMIARQVMEDMKHD